MIIAFVFLLFLVYTITYWKYIISSKYGVVVVYGIMGSGKTTLLQKWITQFASKGWKIYTNYKMAGGQLYDPKIFGYQRFPENSLIICDEAATHFNNRAWKQADMNMLIWLKEIRKHKNRVIFVSQNTDLDKKIRDSAHRIYILKKVWLFSIARLVNSVMEITNNSGDSDNSNGGDIIFKYTYGPIFNWVFTFLPRYSYGFDSFESISNLPYFETYDVDEKVYQQLSKKNYRKYKRKYWAERWKSILHTLFIKPGQYIKQKLTSRKRAKNGLKNDSEKVYFVLDDDE